MVDLINDTLTADLDRAVRAAAPAISGVRIGRRDDRTTWSAVWPAGFVPSRAETAAAQAAIVGFEQPPTVVKPTTEELVASLTARVASLEAKTTVR